MKYMLDTNTLIYFLKSQPASVATRINALGQDDALCMSFVSYAELLKGAERSTRQSELMRRLNVLVKHIPVLYLASRMLCERYASQATRLRESGTPIGGNDLWIGCHALAEEATLVTNNVREFQRLSGLSLENWVG